MTSSSALDVLRELLREFVGDPHAIKLKSNISNIEDLWTLLSDNKLGNLLCENDQLFARQTAYKQSIWSVNAPALSTIFLLAPMFEKNCISYLFIKGPLLLRELYDDHFFRAATDVDLLVALRDFPRAATLLTDVGFRLEPGCESVYWRMFLGEQHYSPPTENLTVVDLHRYVRHPSGRATKLMKNFLEPALRQSIGSNWAAVPTHINLALLLVMYLLKGLMKYESVGYFLLDLAILLTRMDEETAWQLIVEAKERRLMLALCLSLRAVRMIAPLSPTLEEEAKRRQNTFVSEEDLFRRLVSPGQVRNWPRINALVNTCDHANDLFHSLAWEVGRKIAQRAYHARWF